MKLMPKQTALDTYNYQKLNKMVKFRGLGDPSMDLTPPPSPLDCGGLDGWPRFSLLNLRNGHTCHQK